MIPTNNPPTSSFQLVLSAASLFFFILGIKRSFRTADGDLISFDRQPPLPDPADRRER